MLKLPMRAKLLVNPGSSSMCECRDRHHPAERFRASATRLPWKTHSMTLLFECAARKGGGGALAVRQLAFCVRVTFVEREEALGAHHVDNKTPEGLGIGSCTQQTSVEVPSTETFHTHSSSISRAGKEATFSLLKIVYQKRVLRLWAKSVYTPSA